MKKSRILSFIAIVFVMIFMLFNFVTAITIKSVDSASGQLRYTTTSLSEITALKGEWEVFPDLLSTQLPNERSSKMASIEHLWTRNDQGYAFGLVSYRLTVTGLNPNIHYGVYVQDQASAYTLRINGSTVLRNGTPSSNPAIYVSDVKVQTSTFQSDKSGTAVFVMTIANYDRAAGGFWHPVIIGHPESIETYATRIVNMEMFLIAIMISMGLFFFLQSSIDKSRTSMAMSIFSFAVAFRIGSTGVHLIYELVPQLTMMQVTRMDYMSGYLLLPSIGLLTEKLGFTKPVKHFKWILLGLALLIIAYTAFAPDRFLEISYEMVKILVLFYCVYALRVIALGLKNKIEGASIVAIAIVILIAGAYFELYMHSVPYGLYLCAMIFVLMMGITVMIRFSTIHTRKDILESKVLTDELTQVGNRAGLLKELDQAMPVMPGSTRYLLFIDVNHFKSINDQYGHKVGDVVLIETANRFKKSTRSNDRIFRYGGDEFVILAELANAYPIESMIERIRKQFEDPFVIDELILTITLAIGYEAFDPAKKTAEEVIRQSDLKMYEDKRYSDNENSR